MCTKLMDGNPTIAGKTGSVLSEADLMQKKGRSASLLQLPPFIKVKKKKTHGYFYKAVK